MEFALLSALLGLGLLVGLVGGDDDEARPANAGDDNVTGTADADTIETGAGDDTVNSLAGDDRLFLGIGSDTANAGEGEDRVFGGGGADGVTGGPGDDFIDLGDGPDTSVPFDLGGIPQDGGNDTIRGGTGQDTITDSLGINALFGDEGADILNAVDVPGDNTSDTLEGGFGADTLIGDDGDTLQGDPDSGSTQVDTFEARFDEVGESAVTLTDLQRDTETLTLEFDSGTFPVFTNADLSFTEDAPTRTVRISVAGTEVAVLEDQDPGFTLASVTVRMT